MRRLLFVVILAACNAAKPTGPAWPKMAETDPKDDGGESIDPRESSAVASVIEKSEEPATKKAEADAEKKPEAAATKSTDEKPAATTTPSTTPSVDEVITTEEIIIEIDDDD